MMRPLPILLPRFPSKRALVAIAAALAVLSSMVTVADGRAAPVVPRLEVVAPSRAAVGKPIALRIAVRDVAGLSGYEGVLLFDRRAAHVSGMAQRNNDLRRLGREVTPLGPDEVDGGIAFGAYSCATSDCITRRGTRRPVGHAQRLELAVVAITPMRSGVLELGLGAFKFVDGSGRPISVRMPAGAFRIAVGAGGRHLAAPTSRWSLAAGARSGGRFDLSGDGQVTNADARELALDWSITRAGAAPCSLSGDALRSDVNHDGCIDIADVQQLVAAFSPPSGAIGPHAAGPTATATWVVNSKGDEPDAAVGDGVCATVLVTCTLRAAVSESNNHPGPDSITFAIAGTGTQRIDVGSRITLNDRSGPTTIDGYTQPGASPNTDPLRQNAVLRIALRGPSPDTRFPALFVTSPDNVIRGLSLFRFWRAIQLDGFDADRNVIVGNFIGTNPAGTYAVSSWVTSANGGLLINNGSFNEIGRPNLADRNVVSGNAASGIYHTHEGTTNNRSRNNIIGLTPMGDGRLPNRLEGWDANLGASFNTMGGTGAMDRNVSSGNVGSGAEISHGLHTTGWDGGPTVGNRIIGNYIGTDVTGTRTLIGTVSYGNSHYGVHVEDHVQDSEVRWNVIGGNTAFGVAIDGFETTGTIVTNNLIGIGPDGSALPNTSAGVEVSFHARTGRIAHNTITNNRFGVRIRRLDNDGFTISRNSIYGNTRLGIDLAPVGAVNLNDAGDSDNGANQQLNHPVLAAATPSVVKGQACGGCRVEVFRSDDGAGAYGEGRDFLGDAIAGTDESFAVGISTVAVGTFVTATATDAEGNTSEFSLNMRVSAPSPGSPIAADAFSRNRTDGWGSADVGGAWSHLGDAGDYAVDGAVGRMTIPAAGITRTSRSAVSGRDIDLRTTLRFDRVPTGSNAFAYLVGRRGAGAEYQAVVRLAANGEVSLRANATVGSTTTHLGDAVVVSGLTYTAGVPLRVRVRVTGASPTVVRIRLWRAGDPEPATWQFSGSNAAAGLQDAGFIDLRGYLGSGTSNAPVTLGWDDLVVTDVAP